jgi:hypothetical protein
MSGDVLQHRLSLTVRLIDHFSGAPPADEFPVRLASVLVRPVLRSDAAGRRQDDGTYRFRNLQGGPARVLWRQPFSRGHAGWTNWDADPDVILPVAAPAVPLDIAVWPMASATAPQGATGVRGKLQGQNIGGCRVRIAPTGQAFDRFTRSDSAGEFLFLPPGALPTTAPGGRIPLTIEVIDAGGVPRAVNGGRFLPDGAGAPFAGPNFTIPPRGVPRIFFQLA